MQFPGNISDALKSLVLLPPRKPPIPSLDASSVQSKMMEMNCFPLLFLHGERSCVCAYIENSSRYVGPDLGVVLEQEDLEEVMDVGAEDEFIGEEDEGGTRFTTFRVCLGFASPEVSETLLLTIRP